MIHSTCEAGLSDLASTVDRSVASLRQRLDDFDSIASQGTSGLIVASPVALALGKPLIVVRKDIELGAGQRCIHSSAVENSQNTGSRILFLDDHVDRGRTLEDVAAKVRDHSRGMIIAVYQYERDRYTHRGTSSTIQDAMRRESPAYGSSSILEMLSEILAAKGYA